MKKLKKLGVFLQKKAPLWVYTVWHMVEKALTSEQIDVLTDFLGAVPLKGEALPLRLFVIIGQVGAGKSTIARYIAEKTGATVVNANDIRLKLRKAQKSMPMTGLSARS